MGTISQFADWINQTFYHNLRRLITGGQMNTFGHKCIENFAVKGEAIPKYSTTILQSQLNELGIVTITHNLSTNVPQLVLIDEEGNKINITSYCRATVNDSNSININFFDEIPVTGVGYYTLIVLKFVKSVQAPYTTFFEDGFQGHWELTEGADLQYYYTPDYWYILPPETLDGINYYLTKTTEGCLLHDEDGGTIQMEGIWLETKKRYRVEIETTDNVIFNADQVYNINGAVVLDFISTGHMFSIQLDNVTEAIIKYCRIYEY